MAFAPLVSSINTLAVQHQAIVVLQESSTTQVTRIDSIANEIQELRKEKRVSEDVQEAIIKLQTELEDIRTIYIKRIDGMEREIVNMKLFIRQFIKDLEKKYPVED